MVLGAKYNAETCRRSSGLLLCINMFGTFFLFCGFVFYIWRCSLIFRSGRYLPPAGEGCRDIALYWVLPSVSCVRICAFAFFIRYFIQKVVSVGGGNSSVFFRIYDYSRTNGFVATRGSSGY
jgi:hypothetical protein